MPWVQAATRADLDGRSVLGVRVEGRPIAIYALPDGLYATANVCPHLGALLSFGSVTDRNVRTFPVKVEDDRIWVELPEEPA